MANGDNVSADASQTVQLDSQGNPVQTQSLPVVPFQHLSLATTPPYGATSYATTPYGVDPALLVNMPSLRANLFIEEATPPRLAVAYPWWEEEALPILWSFNIEDIKRLMEFRFYDEDKNTRRILHSRNTNTLSQFLLALLPPHTELGSITHGQKVDEIIFLCQMNSYMLHWNWYPDRFRYCSPKEIALEISYESDLQFKAIPFEHWTRFALGYATMSIQWFIEQHRDFYGALYAYLKAYPDQIPIYLEVESQLRTHSPWAHRTVLQCLIDQGYLVADTPDQRIANFILEPIRQLCKFPRRPFATFLRKLSALSIHFARTYHHGIEIDWATPFNTGPRGLEEFLDGDPPSTTARKLTYLDYRDFSGLKAKDIEQDSPKLKALVNNWFALSSSVEECCIAYPEMSLYFQECSIDLVNLQNYYAATAILHGLQDAHPTYVLSLSNPGTYSSLLDPRDNFAVYREFMRKRPGLPFLHPHITTWRSTGVLDIARAFPLSVP